MSFRNEPTLELRRADARDGLLGRARRARPTAAARGAGADRRRPRAPTSGLESTDPGDPGRVVARRRPRGRRAEAAAAVAAADRGLAEWSGPRRGRARGRAERRRRDPARPPARARGAAGARVREAVGGGRRRRLRGDRLPRVLRARRRSSSSAGPELAQAPGERNTMRYEPRGVAAVISPWNFPLAIPTGMTAAALAAGNAVVLKPAEQSPGCALALVEALHGAGVPPAALALLPGDGDAGAALVRDPRVAPDRVHRLGRRRARDRPRRRRDPRRAGPRQAGDRRDGRQELRHRRLRRRPRRRRPRDRRLGLRLRGPEVLGRLAGARPRGGRRVRCSSGSRAPTDSLIVGQAESFATDVPPLIEARGARSRRRAIASDAARSGRLVTAARELPDARLVRAARRGHRAARRRRRCCARRSSARCSRVEPVAGIDGGARASSTRSRSRSPRGLFSRNPETIDAVARRDPGRQPLRQPLDHRGDGRPASRSAATGCSGIGSQAGGPDYLRQFTEPRVVSENTMRHGLETDRA